ncbi:hypothetical protein E4U54_000463 [Claviceps lovelessii]|nr:hypothetical protein E4U54_000463 [Claviceps lovelessii]
MQLSTSTILAAVALLAGQTLANGCTILDEIDAQGFGAVDCKPAGRNRFGCGDTLIFRPGTDTYSVHAGQQEVTIGFFCQGTPKKMIKCPANVWGTVTTPSCDGRFRIMEVTTMP